ncbi:hypothetical protein LSAT2_016730 [Lamellibrachia satsuma]|nr:hypothetical protein LSAT2_016730 [Lamellibrachia satsuma]
MKVFLLVFVVGSVLANDRQSDMTVSVDHKFDACRASCVLEMIECDHKLPALYPSNVYGIINCHKIANICIGQCDHLSADGMH